jgi:hypothetical protein
LDHWEGPDTLGYDPFSIGRSQGDLNPHKLLLLWAILFDHRKIPAGKQGEEKMQAGLAVHKCKKIEKCKEPSETSIGEIPG